MRALFIERASHPLEQAALPGPMWRDELLAQSVAPDQCSEAATDKDQPIALAQQ